MECSFTAINWRGQVVKLVILSGIYDIKPRSQLNTTIQVIVDEVTDGEITITQLVRGMQTKTVKIGPRIWFSMRPTFVKLPY